MDAAAVLPVLESVWFEYDVVGLRLQMGAEVRTRVGDKLRPSSEWEDGRKLARKMSGTSAFIVRRFSDLPDVLRVMAKWNYLPRPGTSDRLAVIGSDHGAGGENMPEQYAVVIKKAVLLAVIP